MAPTTLKVKETKRTRYCVPIGMRRMHTESLAPKAMVVAYRIVMALAV